MERPPDGTKGHAGNAAHGKAFDGHRQGAESMDAKQDRPAGIRHKGNVKKGGAKMLEPLIEPKKTTLELILAKGLPDAIKEVDGAIKALSYAQKLLYDAASKVECTPEEDRLSSLQMDIENLESEVRKQRERMKELQ